MSVKLSSMFLQVPYRILLFILFGMVTSAPWVVMNLDAFSGFQGGWGFVKTLFGVILKGSLIGLSTVFATLHSFFGGVKVGLGTMIFGLIVTVFATFTIYQPIKLFMLAVSVGRQEVHALLIIVISLVITLIILSPIASAVVKGETITSSVKFDKPQNNVVAPSVPQINQTSNLTNSSKIVNSLNMLTGS